MAIKMVGRTTILVHNIKDALAFYMGKLGFTLIYDGGRAAHVGPPSQPGVGLWLMEGTSEERLAQVGRQTADEPCLVMYTDDLIATCRELREKGVRVLWDEPGREPDSQFNFIEDLYGNKIVLVELLRPSPIHNRIGAVFLPVRDIAKARDWYSRILGLPADGEILFGHLYCPKMEGGTGLVLDAKIWNGPLDKGPAFHFNTTDIHAARRFMVENGVELVGEIQHDQFFLFKDPDGNLLMVCRC